MALNPTTPGQRWAVPGERYTCGWPAVLVFTGGRFGDTGWCGATAGPCPFCGGERHEGRCQRYTLRPEVG